MEAVLALFYGGPFDGKEDFYVPPNTDILRLHIFTGNIEDISTHVYELDVNYGNVARYDYVGVLQ